MVVVVATAAGAGAGEGAAGAATGADVGAGPDASSGGVRSRPKASQPPTTATARTATAIIPWRFFFAVASCDESSVTPAGDCCGWLPVPVTFGYDADASAKASDVYVPVPPPGWRRDEWTAEFPDGSSVERMRARTCSA